MKSHVIAVSFIWCSSAVLATAASNNYKFHEPKEFVEIMNNSSITYSMNTENQKIKPFSLIITNKEPYAISPYSRIEQDKNGKMVLIQDEPKGEILKLFESAAEKLKEKKYDEVARLYNQALALDKNYFKTWTNLGDTYYWLGQYNKAEKYLQKAIELNGVGYQEYYFMAETYYKTGNYPKALEYVTRAYMLNKDNPNLMICLQKILKKNNLQLRANRFEFPFEIRKIDDSKCEIYYADKAALNWMAMANCLACWKMESQFQRLLNDKNKGLDMQLTMYRESLINQAVITKQRIDDKEPASKQEMQLYDLLVQDNYLNELLYWEIAAGQAPQVILLLPKEEQNRIAEYIKKYVYQKAA